MKTMYVFFLAPATTENDIHQLFSPYGTVRGIKLSTDVFTGQCRGFGTVAMEGHEARMAIAELNGKAVGEKALWVRFDDHRARRRRRR